MAADTTAKKRRPRTPNDNFDEDALFEKLDKVMTKNKTWDLRFAAYQKTKRSKGPHIEGMLTYKEYLNPIADVCPNGLPNYSSLVRLTFRLAEAHGCFTRSKKPFMSEVRDSADKQKLIMKHVRDLKMFPRKIALPLGPVKDLVAKLTKAPVVKAGGILDISDSDDASDDHSKVLPLGDVPSASGACAPSVSGVVDLVDEDVEVVKPKNEVPEIKASQKKNDDCAIVLDDECELTPTSKLGATPRDKYGFPLSFDMVSEEEGDGDAKSKAKPVKQEVPSCSGKASRKSPKKCKLGFLARGEQKRMALSKQKDGKVGTSEPPRKRIRQKMSMKAAGVVARRLDIEKTRGDVRVRLFPKCHGSVSFFYEGKSAQYSTQNDAVEAAKRFMVELK